MLLQSRWLVPAALACALPLAAAQSAPPANPPSGGDFSANLHPKTKVPAEVILVKGAWSSASDSAPVPEGGVVANQVFTDPYFGITYPLPADWFQKYQGPPPSESGRYVLAQIRPAPAWTGKIPGNILVTAQDLFFDPRPAANALQLAQYSERHLQSDYQLELQPTPATIAGRRFTAFAYWSPVAELHWYVLATEIRCHAVEFVLTSRDPSLLARLMLEMNQMKLPAEASPTGGAGGGQFPVCIKDYARPPNLLEQVQPVFTQQRFNPVPVRIIIGKDGRVEHIHFLSAFPEQARAISAALEQWKFRPYLVEGKPAEVETGIRFGRAPGLAGAGAEHATE